jgi:glycosyltransferase involved in cell wall biosynthesis
LIIVDDGSVDATAKIAIEWVTKINEFNITIAEWQTRQSQKFRNLKIKGVYLAFLDDDLWLLEKLEIQIKRNSKEKCRFSFSDSYIIHDALKLEKNIRNEYSNGVFLCQRRFELF